MLKLKKSILLGSGSPRRKLLLKELGINFRILISNTDEIPLPSMVRGEIAKYLSEEKADKLKSNILENEILITADTIVCLGSKMIGKPGNYDDAFSMLKLLSGQKHQVFTGVTLTDRSYQKTICVESNVVFNVLDDVEIRKYILEYQPFDKAGSYGAQECLMEGINPCSAKEITFLKKYAFENFFQQTLIPETKVRIPIIKEIEGSYFNVMGLPIVELIEELKNFDS